MMLMPLDIPPFAPTAKRSGDIVIHSHSAYRVVDDGSWRSLDDQPERARNDNPSRDNALGLTLWVFAAGMTLALFTIGLLGMAGRG